MTDKLFTVAGTSKLNGETKVRFANDIMRLKVLAKHGHEDITLIELPQAMTKLEAVQFLVGLDEFQGVAEQAAIADYLDAKTPAAKAEKPAKAAPKAKAPAATKAPAKPKAEKAPKQPAEPKIDLSTLEDAPF